LDPKEIALKRYKTIEPFLKRRATLDEISKSTNIAVRTLYNWSKAFNGNGLSGLTPKQRQDRGQRRSVPPELITLIQGLYLRKPPAPISAIHRIVKDVCMKNNWRVPSYDVVHDIVLKIPPNLKTLAHEGSKAYKQAFGLIHRFEADRPNEIWQADHTPLDIFVLDTRNQKRRPWLTAIIDDYSRAVPGYFLGLDGPSSMRIALALRQAIWRKESGAFTICGIPEKFYSDGGSDFVSHHIEQVAIDLKFETVQTEPDDPQGKGKCERLFRTINEMFLSTLPGYAPKGHGTVEAVLTLEQLEEKFKDWLVTQYLTRKHSEIGTTPKERWESFQFLPRMPDSIEQLDLLLMTIAKERLVRRDGIRVLGFRYFDVSLTNGYIGEYVTVRYDPRDLAQVHVYSNNSLICKASCAELSGKKVTLKEVQQARNHEAKLQRQKLKELLAIAEMHVPMQLPPPLQAAVCDPVPPADYPKIKIKRFACDDD
jgi:putative transposase